MPLTKLAVFGIADGGKTSHILKFQRELLTLKKGIKLTKEIERSNMEIKYQSCR